MNIQYIGWNNRGTHDKLWGVVLLEKERYLVFWGRRGQKLKYKMEFTNNYVIQKAIELKSNNGYTRVDYHKLNDIHPELEENLSKTIMLAILKS